MGAWGPAIFSDDTACDVRACYRELLEDGRDGAEAKRLVLEKFAELANDQDQGPVLWLALAMTQWKLGRLDDEVKGRALEIIGSGAGLDLWEEAGPRALDARKKALAKLRDQLVSPQPPEKKLRKPWRYVTDLKVGDAISYRLDSGQFVILRVVFLQDTRYWLAPTFELCDWTGDVIPSHKDIERLPYVVRVEPILYTDRMVIVPHNRKAYPSDRICVVAHGIEVRPVRESHTSCAWIAANKWLNAVEPHLSKKLPGLLRRLHQLLPSKH